MKTVIIAGLAGYIFFSAMIASFKDCMDHQRKKFNVLIIIIKSPSIIHRN